MVRFCRTKFNKAPRHRLERCWNHPTAENNKIIPQLNANYKIGFRNFNTLAVKICPLLTNSRFEGWIDIYRKKKFWIYLSRGLCRHCLHRHVNSSGSTSSGDEPPLEPNGPKSNAACERQSGTRCFFLNVVLEPVVGQWTLSNPIVANPFRPPIRR